MLTSRDVLSKDKRDEYEKDLWMITGVLDHNITFVALEKEMAKMAKSGKLPDFTYRTLK